MEKENNLKTNDKRPNKKLFFSNLIKNFEKKENVPKNFFKKNVEANVENCGTNSKKKKISEEFVSESEKAKISFFKYKVKNKEKKGKNKEQKYYLNDNSAEDLILVKNNKNIYNEKIKNKVFENKENNIYKGKKANKLYSNNYINDFIENKSNNIKRRYMKINKDKYNIIYIIYFYLFIISKIFFSQYIKCNYRKIEYEYSYINLKINGTGDINILSSLFNSDDYPSTIIINNIEQNVIKNSYYFNEQENNINNITMIWNKSLESTNSMFHSCDKIIEIDLSNFDTSSVKSMNGMFCECPSLISLDLSNFNKSNIKTMAGIFSGCS